MILCAELAVIWLVYYLYGWLASGEMPLWLTTCLVIGVDRITSLITELSGRRRGDLPGRDAADKAEP